MKKLMMTPYVCLCYASISSGNPGSINSFHSISFGLQKGFIFRNHTTLFVTRIDVNIPLSLYYRFFYEIHDVAVNQFLWPMSPIIIREKWCYTHFTLLMQLNKS